MLVLACTIGKPSARNPRILSASRNFAKTMHPFAFRKEWIRGFGGKDTKRVEEGYDTHTHTLKIILLEHNTFVVMWSAMPM